MKIAPQTLNQMLARNPQLTVENQLTGKVQGSKPERDKTPALVRTVKRETSGVPGITVRFTGYRVRPLDPDNFAGGCKDLLDGLRHAQLIPGDDPFQIALETRQIKVTHYRDEFTLVEISS